MPAKRSKISVFGAFGTNDSSLPTLDVADGVAGTVFTGTKAGGATHVDGPASDSEEEVGDEDEEREAGDEVRACLHTQSMPTGGRDLDRERTMRVTSLLVGDGGQEGTFNKASGEGEQHGDGMGESTGGEGCKVEI